MHTSLSDLTTVIESIEFGANLRVFSGFNSFYGALRENHTINQLQQLLADYPAENEQLLLRLKTLLAQNDEPRYAHPHDVPIASYLFVLSNVSHNELAIEAAKKVLATANLIWAKRLAEIVLAEQTVPHES